MANTITSFPIAVAGTKARASDFNAAFDNYRGDLIAIEPLTATGAHLTYDLGSTEYRWDNVYARVLDLIGATTTTNLTIARNVGITAGAFDIAVGGSTIGSYRPSGGWLKSNRAISAPFSASTSSLALVTLASSLLSLTTYGGDVEFGLIPACDTLVTSIISIDNAATSTFATVNFAGTLRYFMDGSQMSVHAFAGLFNPLPTTTGQLMRLTFPVFPLCRRFALAPGGHTFYASMEVNTIGAIFIVDKVEMMVKEG